MQEKRVNFQELAVFFQLFCSLRSLFHWDIFWTGCKRYVCGAWTVEVSGTSARRKADCDFLQHFCSHLMCCLIWFHQVLLAVAICKGSIYLWRLWNEKYKMKFFDKSGVFCLAASKDVNFWSYSSKSSEVLPGSGKNPVPILSELQSKVRERTHQT